MAIQLNPSWLQIKEDLYLDLVRCCVLVRIARLYCINKHTLMLWWLTPARLMYELCFSLIQVGSFSLGLYGSGSGIWAPSSIFLKVPVMPKGDERTWGSHSCSYLTVSDGLVRNTSPCPLSHWWPLSHISLGVQEGESVGGLCLGYSSRSELDCFVQVRGPLLYF